MSNLTIVFGMHRVIIDSFDERSKPYDVWVGHSYLKTPFVPNAFEVLKELCADGYASHFRFFVLGMKTSGMIKKTRAWFQRNITETLSIPPSHLSHIQSVHAYSQKLQRMQPAAVVEKIPAVLSGLRETKCLLFRPTDSALESILDIPDKEFDVVENWHEVQAELHLHVL